MERWKWSSFSFLLQIWRKKLLRWKIFLKTLSSLCNLPIFWTIREMVAKRNNLYFKMETLEKRCFNFNSFSFIVTSLDTNLSFISSTQLADFPVRMESFFYKGSCHVKPNYYQLLWEYNKLMKLYRSLYEDFNLFEINIMSFYGTFFHGVSRSLVGW